MNAVDQAYDAVATGGAAARREQNRREMRVAILDAARAIVDEAGADKLTVRGIAQRLGYSAGAIYDYFPSKEHILHALYFLGTDGLGQQMALAVASLPPGTSVVDALLALARTYRAYAHAHVDLYWLAFSGIKERPDGQLALDPEEKQGIGFDSLLAIVAAGIANGTLVDDIPPMAIALAAWSSVHGFVSLELSGHMKPEVLAGETDSTCLDRRDIATRDDLFETLIRMILYGFVRRASP